MSRLDKARELLLDLGTRPSMIRMHILSFLLSHPIHPTVEQIYRALQPQIPTLSKTTIYNTLDLLMEKGIVRQLVIDNRETHYEMNLQEHGHFYCTECGEIFDFTIGLKPCKASNLNGFTIKEKNVYFCGICSDCQKKKEEDKK